MTNQVYVKQPDDSLKLRHLSTVDWILKKINNDPEVENDQSLVATYFEDLKENDLLPETLPSTSGVQAFSRLQDHLAIRFTTSLNDYEQAIKTIEQALSEANFNKNYLVYPINKNNNRNEYYLVQPVSQMLTSKEAQYFKQAALIDSIEDNLKQALPDFHLMPEDLFNNDLYAWQLTAESFYIKHLTEGNDYYIDPEIIKSKHLDGSQPKGKSKKKKDEESSIQYSSTKLTNRLKDFINEPQTSKILKDDAQTHTLLQALANNHWNKAYPKEFEKQVIDALSDLGIRSYEELLEIYTIERSKLKANPDTRLKAQHFGKYLQIYKSNKNLKQNIAQQFISSFSDDFEPSADIELSVAGQAIAEIYPPALIKQQGDDKDNLVIFDPLQGCWVHNENDLYSLLTAIRPYSKFSDLDTLMRTLAAQARNQGNIIEPYSKSSHLLFKNGVLDISNAYVDPRDHKLHGLEFHDLNEQYVRDLNFIKRGKIEINWDPTVTQPKKFKNRRNGGKEDWDPESFISAYSKNDPVREQYFYFLLSLGLFPQHNFGINIDIQGSSRWGKTTISYIFDGLYQHRIKRLPFSSLNDRFAFTTYDNNTAIIWFDECNTGIEPLNDTIGTPMYDSLANDNLRMQVKSKGDRYIKNPPQTFVDGTGFVPSTELNTGPVGRTLILKLPAIGSDVTAEENDALRIQAYANGIYELLTDTNVLQYLVNKMIYAYCSFLKFDNLEEQHAKLNDMKIVFGGTGKTNDIHRFPQFVEDWRDEMVGAQDEMGVWFEDEFEPYLTETSTARPAHGRPATNMHDKLAYILYRTSYLRHNEATDKYGRNIMDSDRFNRQLHALYQSHHWNMKIDKENDSQKAKRRQFSTLKRTNFDFESYEHDGLQLPDELNSNNHARLAYPLDGARSRGWYVLLKDSTK